MTNPTKGQELDRQVDDTTASMLRGALPLAVAGAAAILWLAFFAKFPEGSTYAQLLAPFQSDLSKLMTITAAVMLALVVFTLGLPSLAELLAGTTVAAGGALLVVLAFAVVPRAYSVWALIAVFLVIIPLTNRAFRALRGRLQGLSGQK